MGKVFLIAEAACTWRSRTGHEVYGHDWYTLCKLADQVKRAGFNALKIQWVSDANELANRRGLDSHTPYLPLEFDARELAEFSDMCRTRELVPMCTAFLPQDVPVVAPLVGRYKVASLEALCEDMRDAYRKQTSKPLYISCGAMTEEEVFQAKSLWAPLLQSEFLHCVAAYPAPPGQLNLTSISNYDFIGFSDHSMNRLTGALAVACGAAVLEVHVRPDECGRDNADYWHSLSSLFFQEYANFVRLAEAMLGDSQKKLEPSEVALAPYRARADR